MRSLAKKILIYSMVGLMQFGLGTAVLEAAPRQNDRQQEQRHENDRQQWERQQQLDHQDRDSRRFEENDRHQREMQRRHDESERAWHERQRYENERHEQTIRDIEGAALIYLLLTK